MPILRKSGKIDWMELKKNYVTAYSAKCEEGFVFDEDGVKELLGENCLSNDHRTIYFIGYYDDFSISKIIG